MEVIGLIFGLGIAAGVGALIGKKKNRTGEGAIWGFFLGILGWIIIALRDPKTE